jgi:hypothetical protein
MFAKGTINRFGSDTLKFVFDNGQFTTMRIGLDGKVALYFDAENDVSAIPGRPMSANEALRALNQIAKRDWASEVVEPEYDDYTPPQRFGGGRQFARNERQGGYNLR